MKSKLKKSLKHLVYSIALFLLVFPTQVAAVGFHSSGSSSSSSGGSSSGGSIGGLIGLVIAYIIITKLGRKNALEKQKRLSAEKGLFLTEDMNFCEEILESQIQNNILDVLYAINDNNTNELSIYCTDKFIQNYDNVATLRNLNVEHIAWVTPNIEKIYTEDNYDYILLNVKFDIIENKSTSQKIMFITLKRLDKVVSKGLNQSNTLNACKCCGAPMDYKKTYTCEYCGNPSKLSENDTWMIDNVTTGIPNDWMINNNQQ